MKTSLVSSTLALVAIVTAQMASLHHRDTLHACDAAPNCELYDTPHGQMLRFKAGMEPGTADYESRFSNTTEHRTLVKRNTQTHVTFGQTSINYGTTNPCEAIHHCAYDYCHEGSCDPAECTVATQVIVRQGSSTGPSSRTLTLTTNGQYNGWDERNNYAAALEAAASKGQKWTKHDWCIKNKGQEDYCGTQWWGEQTDFIAMNKFYNGNLRGFITIKITMDGGEDNWCSRFASTLGAIAGAINPIAGGFFGLVGVLCS